VRIWWISVAAWIGVIFFSSTSTASYWCESAFNYVSGIFMSGVPRDSTSYGAVHLAADKGLHITLFAVLGLLLVGAMVRPRKKILRILTFGFVVGCCSEYLQSFFPDRDPAFRDVLINLGGTGLGVLISRLWWKKRTAVRTQKDREYSLTSSDGH
jgi:VanZ family protein